MPRAQLARDTCRVLIVVAKVARAERQAWEVAMGVPVGVPSQVGKGDREALGHKMLPRVVVAVVVVGSTRALAAPLAWGGLGEPVGAAVALAA
ncbi:MAG TPA: hypothetical protein VKA46_11985 [Gemmataceae bacterium]|nr:hypothetical protein [Gemmataceae bacterium]